MAKIDDSVKKKVPELRFPGFTDDWEERKLSGIIEKLSGGASIKPSYLKAEIVRFSQLHTSLFKGFFFYP